MNHNFDATITSRQRSWIEEAFSLTTYRTDRSNITLNYTASENLPVVDHNAYMCTVGLDGGSTFTVTIQPWSDQRSGPANDTLTGDALRKFFRESIIHEMMHAVQFDYRHSDPDKTALASCFVKNPGPGHAPQVGTLADYNPSGSAWADRIQEAIAETGKDIWLPRQYRQFDNRTNWKLQPEDF